MGNLDRVMMMRDGLNHNTVDAPQSEQVGAYLGVRDSKQFHFSFGLPATSLLHQCQDSAELIRHFAGQHQLSDIMKQRGDTIEKYDQMIGEGNTTGNAVVQAAIDALIAQTRGVERAIALLKLDIKVEGSDSLDNPSAVFK